MAGRLTGLLTTSTVSFEIHKMRSRLGRGIPSTKRHYRDSTKPKHDQCHKNASPYHHLFKIPMPHTIKMNDYNIVMNFRQYKYMRHLSEFNLLLMIAQTKRVLTVILICEIKFTVTQCMTSSETIA